MTKNEKVMNTNAATQQLEKEINNFINYLKNSGYTPSGQICGKCRGYNTQI